MSLRIEKKIEYLTVSVLILGERERERERDFQLNIKIKCFTLIDKWCPLAKSNVNFNLASNAARRASRSARVNTKWKRRASHASCALADTRDYLH